MSAKFNRVWAENTTIQEWTDAQYKAGWAAIGDTPPTVEQFDAVLNLIERKANYVYKLGNGKYDPTRRYPTGYIGFFADDPAIPHIGNYYECYHPDGCQGKDPRDTVNRPDGWTNTDPAAPYYWLNHGKWIEQATIGAAVPIQRTTVSSQLYIKYRNDGNLHKDKFWRLAEVYPDLISGNIISIADLRAEFIRGLDDGRGVDAGRAVGTWQADEIRSHTHAIERAWSPGYEEPANIGGGNDGGNMNHSGNTAATGGSETRPRNIAMLYQLRF